MRDRSAARQKIINQRRHCRRAAQRTGQAMHISQPGNQAAISVEAEAHHAKAAAPLNNKMPNAAALCLG